MGMGDNIIVGDFMFCRDHGDEYCHICCCDHRMCNNMRFENELDELVQRSNYDFDPEERRPLNAYANGAVLKKGDDYKCRKHGKVDCATCFDWLSMIRAEVGLDEVGGSLRDVD